MLLLSAGLEIPKFIYLKTKNVFGQTFDFVSDMKIVSRTQIANDTFIVKRRRNYTYHKQFPFLLERKRCNITYYRCIQRHNSKCKARLVAKRLDGTRERVDQINEHNHEPATGTIFK